MEEKTIFPREEKSEILFEKILRDPWACEKLMDTFCNYLFCNDDFDCNLSPEEFTKSLLSAYLDRDMSAFLMSICNNTMFDLLRNSYKIPCEIYVSYGTAIYSSLVVLQLVDNLTRPDLRCS